MSYKLDGKIISGYIRQSTQAIFRRLSSISLRRGPKHSSPSMDEHTQYKMWLAGMKGVTIKRNLLGIWLGWRMRSLIQYPYLREVVGGGSGARNALLNWSVIGIMLWLGSPYIKMFIPNPDGSDIAHITSPVIIAGSPTPYNFGSINVVVEVNYPTPSAGVAEIVPTSTPDYSGYPVYVVAYSYYNPDLGGVNWHTDNWNGERCADTTASGISWRDNVGKAVAVPPSWVCTGLGYGSYIEVLNPETIRGRYMVVDLCSGCEALNWEDKTWRLDFLDLTQKLTWAYPVEIRIDSIAISPSPFYRDFRQTSHPRQQHGSPCRLKSSAPTPRVCTVPKSEQPSNRA